jgi:hypothetical protein
LPGCAGVTPRSINPKEKNTMRKVLFSLVAAAAIGAGFTVTNANAAPVAPSAVAPAIADSNLAQDVRWVRRCWVNRWGHTRCRTFWRGGHDWRWSRRW